jgi:GNAT superfamily N-acetyltransferase
VAAESGPAIRIGGYFPGAVGWITALHATYYYENWGFDATFETQVGLELADFIRAYQPGRDGFWTARAAEKPAGSIAVDGRPGEEAGARLRWFIVATPFQQCGIGRRLLDTALAFCRKAGHRRVYLWTFQGLDSARRLYEEAGFGLSREHEVTQWGRRLREQQFVLER